MTKDINISSFFPLPHLKFCLRTSVHFACEKPSIKCHPQIIFCMFYFARRGCQTLGENNVILADLRLQLTNKEVYKNCHINFAHHFTGAETLCHTALISCFAYLKAQSTNRKEMYPLFLMQIVFCKY